MQRLVRLREETAMLAEDLEEMSKVPCRIPSSEARDGVRRRESGMEVGGA